ncbi:hypothetical protein ACIBO2_00930 [Nonomuraea sp. NPDC050022]|uniref:hypothetical protein n=1 Tax=Nonomuraea sp. NPDC050022 TaxID=3364358 RepID=UPI0037AE65CC
MSVTWSRKPAVVLALALVVVGAVLVLNVRVNTSGHRPVDALRVSADGRTLTAQVIVGPPQDDGTFCEQVTDTAVRESARDVAIGIEMRDDCRPWLYWSGREVALDIGFRREVRVELRTPLGGRPVVDVATGSQVPIQDVPPARR